MKSILKGSRMILATLLVVAAQSVPTATAQPVSPVFTNGVVGWDCLISGKGSERGIIYLTFYGDGTPGNNSFSGALVSARVATPKVSTDRSGFPSDRDPADPQLLVTNLYGFTTVTGQWNFDAKGYTIGVFTHDVSSGDSTNSNQISFKAKIKPNKRFTASFSSSIGGNGTYRGVPIKAVTNLAGFTGSWSATEKNSSLTSYEWLSLSPTNPLGANWPNIYAVSGYGPGYDLSGTCLVSSQKRIGFGNLKNFVSGSETNAVTNSILRGTVGSLINKSTSLGGKTKGLSDSGTNVISYDAFWVAPPVPE